MTLFSGFDRVVNYGPRFDCRACILDPDWTAFPGPNPVHIHIHGGAWKDNGQSALALTGMGDDLGQALRTQHGYVIISLDHPPCARRDMRDSDLQPSQFPEIYNWVPLAVQQVKTHYNDKLWWGGTGSRNVDVMKISAGGISSGAALALDCALAPDGAFPYGGRVKSKARAKWKSDFNHRLRWINLNQAAIDAEQYYAGVAPAKGTWSGVMSRDEFPVGTFDYNAWPEDLKRRMTAWYAMLENASQQDFAMWSNHPTVGSGLLESAFGTLFPNPNWLDPHETLQGYGLWLYRRAAGCFKDRIRYGSNAAGNNVLGSKLFAISTGWANDILPWLYPGIIPSGH